MQESLLRGGVNEHCFPPRPRCAKKTAESAGDSAIPARALLTDQGSPGSNCIGASIRWI